MTLHDFVKWCHDSGLGIVETTIDHGGARIHLAAREAGHVGSEWALDLDGPDGAWTWACEFVDKFGGLARWYGADVVMRLNDGPTISIRTLCEPMSDERPRRRYPETKDLPWPPTDDEQLGEVGSDGGRGSTIRRPDWMSLTDYHGDA